MMQEFGNGPYQPLSFSFLKQLFGQKFIFTSVQAGWFHSWQWRWLDNSLPPTRCTTSRCRKLVARQLVAVTTHCSDNSLRDILLWDNLSCDNSLRSRIFSQLKRRVVAAYITSMTWYEMYTTKCRCVSVPFSCSVDYYNWHLGASVSLKQKAIKT